jgi:hypothetical protein
MTYVSRSHVAVLLAIGAIVPMQSLVSRPGLAETLGNCREVPISARLRRCQNDARVRTVGDRRHLCGHVILGQKIVHCIADRTSNFASQKHKISKLISLS